MARPGNQRSGIINTAALATPADNVKVAKSTRSPFDTELDDQQGANAVEAFVKATLHQRGHGATSGQSVQSVGQCRLFRHRHGWHRRRADFQAGFDMDTGRFVIHCKAELAFKLGVGGGFFFTVDAVHVKDFLVLLYNELSDAEFNVIDS